MSMYVDFERNELVFLIPNSESPMEAQHKGISNRTVGSFYMSDKYNDCFSFLNEFEGNYYIDLSLCITQASTLLKILKNNHLESSFKNNLISQANSLEALKWFAKEEQCWFYKIAAPVVNDQKKYLKFDNSDTVFKLLKTLLLGDLTKLVIKKISKDGFILYIDFIDDLDDKIKNKTISQWALSDI